MEGVEPDEPTRKPEGVAMAEEGACQLEERQAEGIEEVGHLSADTGTTGKTGTSLTGASATP